MAQTTPHVIDLVSSSPQAPIRPQPDLPDSERWSPPDRAAGRPKRAATLALGLECVNEASCAVVIDLDDSDQCPDIEVRGPKRRRALIPPPSLGPSFKLSSCEPHAKTRDAFSASDPDSAVETVIRSTSMHSRLSKGQDPGSTHASAYASTSNPILPRASPNTIHPEFFLSSPLPLRPISSSSEMNISHTATKTDSNHLCSSPIQPNHQSRAQESSTTTTTTTGGHIYFCDLFETFPDAGIGPAANRPREKTYLRDQTLDSINPRGSSRRNHWDPISSSASDPIGHRPLPRTLQREVIELDSDSEGQHDSDDDLPDIANLNTSKFQSRRRSPTQQSRSDLPSGTRKRPIAALKKSSEQRKIDREVNAAAKAVEKERRQKEKERAKEDKAREKKRAAALAEVNKVRTDKKVSTPEMIVMMPSSIDDGLRTQVLALLDGLGVQHSDWDSPAGTVFKWCRKVISCFDEEMGRWEPVPLQVKPENHALTILTAEKFVELFLADALDISIRQTKGHLPGLKAVYIIQGMIGWMRRNRNIRNRQFASVVRHGGADASTQPRRQKSKVDEEHINEDLIEDAMLRLQIEHEVLIHHTETQLDTAQWIVHFTQHVSTIPYRKQRDEATSSAGFCMESGQVRTGEDTHDTYIRMLQEIVRVTVPIAHGIAAEFDTVSKLVNGLESGGPATLEGLKKGANRDGGLSDRMVGKAMSKRIYKVFTGLDENSSDV